MTVEAAKAHLISTADAMLQGRLQLIEGCRRIWHLSHELGDPDNPVFLPIRAIESETDRFPLGEVRKQYAPEYLREIDKEMQRYLDGAREDILNSCREIIRSFS